MHLTEQAYFKAITGAFPLPPVLRVEERDSGMNNTTRYAVCSNEEVFVVRIYENHRSPAKLAAEHELLLQLGSLSLPFRIPVPLAGHRGGTWTEAPDGKLAAVFAHLPGKRPDAGRHVLSYAYGSVVGRLTLAMEGLRLEAAPSYPPYDELLGPAAAETSSAARRLYADDPALSALAGEAQMLLDILQSLNARAQDIRRLDRQWIHGDFSHANALMQDEKISAVLDFEFATVDVRAMELAVCLGEQLSAPGGLSRTVLSDMVSGYRSVRPLAKEELDLLPELLQLRKLDVFLHFLHRYQSGLDPAAVLQDQTRKSAAVCRYIREQADWIRNL